MVVTIEVSVKIVFVQQADWRISHKTHETERCNLILQNERRVEKIIIFEGKFFPLDKTTICRDPLNGIIIGLHG